MTPNRAEEIALLALGWLVSNDELLPVFLGASGASLHDVKQGASDPALHLALMDFLLMDDQWVMACCQALNLPNDALAHARQSLPSGAQVHWT